MTLQADGAQFNIELVHLYRDAMRAIEQVTGMSQSRMEIMHDLLHVAEMSQAELQERLGVEGAVVTRIVKQLESAGLVLRRADPRDNRFTLVSLSAEARANLQNSDMANFKTNFGEQVLKGLDAAEHDRLLLIMRRIHTNLNQFQPNTDAAQAEAPEPEGVPVLEEQPEGWQFYVEIVHLYRAAMRVTEQVAGMSQTRLEILHDLWHVDEMSQAELQQRLDVEGAVVTRIVKQLESAGQVTRRADPRDNRFTLVALSEAARKHPSTDEALKFKANFGTQLMQGLDDSDRAFLLSAVKRIQTNITSPEINNYRLG